MIKTTINLIGSLLRASMIVIVMYVISFTISIAWHTGAIASDMEKCKNNGGYYGSDTYTHNR